MFENAKWITTRYGGPDLDIVPAPFFRKKLEIKSDVKKATIYVCALGYGEYYINGYKIHNDVLTTPYTNYEKTVLYNKYDVTEFLTAGTNVFGVILGNGPYHAAESNAWKDAAQAWTANPKFIMQLEVTYKNGEKETFLSDTECVWTTAEIVYNEWKMAEIHDNRLIIKDWSKSEFDDSSWNKSFVAFPPGGVLQETYIPPINITEELPMKKIAENIYDCGQNLSGWVNLTVSGKKDQEISIIYSERFVNGDIDTSEICTLTEHTERKHIDKVILSGEGEEQFEPKFVYHGFRYVKLLNAPENVKLTAKFLHTDLNTVGEFSCSCETLNELHRMIKWATLSNYHGIPTDCPQREQNGWTADSYLSAQQVLMNYDIDKTYTKWVHDLADCQKLSGQIPCVVPQTSWGYNWGSCPSWDTPLLLIPYQMYQINGDTDIVEFIYPYGERYMSFLYTIQEGYIIKDGLGDWVAPLESTNKCPVWVTETAYYYNFACVMAEFSKVLGKDASKYEELAQNIKTAFRNKFFADGKPVTDSQTALACVVYQGLAEENEVPQLVKLLADKIEQNGCHHDCGILGNKYIYHVLTENGYIDLLYKLTVIKTYPSYGYWVEQKHSSLPENWDCSKASLNHHMFSEVDFWCYKYLAGIDITEKGLVIKPYFAKDVSWVKAKHKGIEVSYDMNEITITVDRKATVVLPDNTYEVEKGIYSYKLTR